MTGLLEIFGKSPFTPLKEHMNKVKECVSLVPEFMHAYLEQDYEKAKIIFKQICKVEHEADEIKKELRNHLPKSFLMPVARADLLSYLKQQDNIADAAEDMGALCMLKYLTLPKELHEKLMHFIDKNIEAVKVTHQVSNMIAELIDGGFGSKKSDEVLEMIEQINFLEYECDKAQMSFGKKLFEYEKEMDPVTVMLWFNIVRVISNLSNSAEGVGTRMRLMLAKG